MFWGCAYKCELKIDNKESPEDDYVDVNQLMIMTYDHQNQNK